MNTIRGRQGSAGLHARLAEHLFQIEEGERLPSIRGLAASIHMSVGSVSSALNDLQDMGAVEIQKRGHMGSVLVARSLGVLWDLLERGPLVFAMSLPMHRRFEGLATALKIAFGRVDIVAYPIFVRGSRTRLKALMEQRCDVAVMSGLAADELCDQEQEILLRLPPGSWISHYSVYYRADPPEPRDCLRVAVDPDSYDHTKLAELEFADEKTEFTWASYMQFSRLLRNGDVDAIVWTADENEVYLGPGIQQRPLSSRVMELVGERPMSATFVARAHSDAVRAVLKAAIKADEIAEIQSKVIAGSMIPKY